MAAFARLPLPKARISVWSAIWPAYAQINDFGFIETPFVKVIKEVTISRTITEGKIVRDDILDLVKKEVVIKAGEKITAELAKQLSKSSRLKNYSN